jgi:hypothetical protein
MNHDLDRRVHVATVLIGVITGSVTACGPDPTQNRLDHCQRHVASFFGLWRNPMMVLRFYGPIAWLSWKGDRN